MTDTPEYRPRFISQVKAVQFWIEKSRTDVAAFIEYVSGKRPAKHHLIWLANIFHPERTRVNIIGPRDSGKTVTLVYAMLWYISKNPLSSNAIISVTATQAESRLMMIKNLIQEDPRYRNVFPHIFVDERQANTQTAFSLVSRENDMPYSVWRSQLAQYGSLKDPTLFVAGNGGAIIGARWSGLCIFDDIVDQTYLTLAAQKKVMLYINMTILPCIMDSCKMISIGTRWMLDDIYSMFIANKTWFSIIIPAILYDAEGKEHPYWPEYWPLEKLQRKRDAMDDEVAFRTMYLCDPTASADNKFSLAVFNRDLPNPLPQFDRLYICVDLAIKTNVRSDWTVLVALAQDRDNNIYMLDIARFRADELGAVKQLGAFWDKVNEMWGPHTNAGRVNAMLFEAVGFQTAYAVLLTTIRPDIIATPIPIKGSKGERAEPLTQWANLGKFFINQLIDPQLRAIVQAEWTNFPNHRHDDTLDAASLLFQAKTISFSSARLTTIKLNPEAFIAAKQQEKRDNPGKVVDVVNPADTLPDDSILWLLNSTRRNQVKTRFDQLH